MQRQEAIRRLRRMFGKDFAYEVRDNAPSPEEREQAKERNVELVANRKKITDALEERRRVLFQDAEFQRLKEEYKVADKLVNENAYKLHTHKFTVGTSNKLFFHVKAQGDTWEEIFAKLKAEAGK